MSQNSIVSGNSNVDPKTVSSFGDEWSRYRQDKLTSQELKLLFDRYFHIFPWESLPANPEGFDMGCGSGRWASLVAPMVSILNCIEPSRAYDVAKANLSAHKNVRFFNQSVDTCSLPLGSQDFGYCLGVLHHIPDTQAALDKTVKLLKPGAPFLLYLYYSLDNQPLHYSIIWKLSELIRFLISSIPSRSFKSFLTELIALMIYAPLVAAATVLKKAGLPFGGVPLHSYSGLSYYTMRTDARDRFGTPLEQRFSKREIETICHCAGLERLVFSDKPPFWTVLGFKSVGS